MTIKYKDLTKKQRVRRLEKNAISHRKRRSRCRLEIIEILGNKCVWCGETDFRCIHVDHINGGGGLERKKWYGEYYMQILKKLKTGSRNYQLLCANCNCRKMHDNNEVGRNLS